MSPVQVRTPRQILSMNESRRNKIISVVKQRQAGIIVVLEDIHDPHNAAAILRTCDGIGMQNVYFIFEKETEYNPKKIGKASSSSANKWLNFQIFHSTETCLTKLHNEGYTIIATALTQTSESLMTATFQEPKIALFVGNEKNGLSPGAITRADRTLMIPMLGFVQSLNVSVATGIILWEITKQRMNKFLLINKEQLNLQKDLLLRGKT